MNILAEPFGWAGDRDSRDGASAPQPIGLERLFREKPDGGGWDAHFNRDAEQLYRPKLNGPMSAGGAA